jgi:hypothetical protein
MADHTIYVQIDPQGTQTLVITDENEQTVSSSVTASGQPVTDNGKGVRKRVKHGKSVSWCVGPPGASLTVDFGSTTPLSSRTVSISPSTSSWTCSGDNKVLTTASADRYKYTITYLQSSTATPVTEDPQIIIDDVNGLPFATLLEQNALPVSVVAVLLIVGLAAWVIALRKRLPH